MNASRERRTTIVPTMRQHSAMKAAEAKWSQTKADQRTNYEMSSNATTERELTVWKFVVGFVGVVLVTIIVAEFAPALLEWVWRVAA